MARATIVLLTAPLGLIGVVAFLLLFNKPFGFVAMLGTIALFGMIMRNSLILIDQIEQDILAGQPAWDAVIDANDAPFPADCADRIGCGTGDDSIIAQYFLRSNGGVPGGLIVATFLTLFFLPALYAAWFKVKKSTINV